MPKITVYMPNHNYGLYIDKAVQSVLKQSIADWELIIIDDGSVDDSREKLKKYRNDPRITVIEQENKGLNVTNNVAIRLARGKYIVRIDADDFVDENFLLVLSNILDQKPDVGLVYPDYYHVDPDGNIIETVRRKKIKEEVELLDMPAHGACTMFRKDILLNLGSYNEEFTCQDGYDIWIRFISKYQPYNVNIPLFYYRQHSQSLTTNHHKILDTRRAIKKKVIDGKGGIKTKTLAFIPIIMTSIYHQNRPFVKLLGKPLLWYTLSETVKSDYFDNIIVSSENEDVLDYVSKNFPQIKLVRRNASNANRNVSNPKLISEAIEHHNLTDYNDNDSVCILSISTPLRKVKHIEHAIDAMDIFGVDTVLSVVEELAPCYKHEKNGLVAINPVNENQPRLERNSIYKENGGVLLTKLKNVDNQNIYGAQVGHILMLPEESIKLSSDFDFWLAENIIKNIERQ